MWGALTARPKRERWFWSPWRVFKQERREGSLVPRTELGQELPLGATNQDLMMRLSWENPTQCRD